MKKGLTIVGECILLIVALLVLKIVLNHSFPETNDSNVMSFVLYCISAFGGVIIYHLNTRK